MVDVSYEKNFTENSSLSHSKRKFTFFFLFINFLKVTIKLGPFITLLDMMFCEPICNCQALEWVWIQNLRWGFCHTPLGGMSEMRGLGY